MDWLSDTPKSLLEFYTKHFLPISFIHDEGERAKAAVKFKTQERQIMLGWYKRQSNEKIELTGSRAEGLSIPDYAVWGGHDPSQQIPYYQSDFDEMTTAHNLYTGNTGKEKCRLFDIEQTDDPRYVKLRMTPDFKILRAKEGVVVESLYCVNTVATTEALKTVKEVGKVLKHSLEEIHGPSACSIDRMGIHSRDTVFCFRCDIWPANEWLSRPRPSGWPSEKQIQEAVKIGCHVAPVGRLASKTRLHEWRYSFSLVERMLAHSLTDIQRKAYIYLKILSSFAIQSSVVSTYHLKNIFFRSCENLPLKQLKDEDVYSILLYILDQLISSLATGYLQHYFFSGSNMLAQAPRQALRSAAQATVRVRRNLFHYLMAFEEKVAFLNLTSRARLKICDALKSSTSKTDASGIANIFKSQSRELRQKCLDTLLESNIKSLENILKTDTQSERSFQYLATVNWNSVSSIILSIAKEIQKVKLDTQPFDSFLAKILIANQPSPQLIARLFLYLKSTEKQAFAMSLNTFMMKVLGSLQETQKANRGDDRPNAEWVSTMEILARSSVYPDDVQLSTDTYNLYFEHTKWNWIESFTSNPFALSIAGLSVEYFEKLWRDASETDS